MSLSFVNSHSSSQRHKDAIWASRWTVKGNVITASVDGTLAQWDPISGQQIRALPPHTLGIVSLSAPALGEMALYNTLEGMTGLWDLSSGEVKGKYESYMGKKDGLEPAWQVSLHPKLTTYAAVGASGKVTIHTALPSADSDSSFGSLKATMDPGRAKYGMSIAHSPDGARIAAATEAGQIYVFDSASGSLATTFSSHAMCVRTLCWSPDSQLLISGSDDKRITLHDIRTTSSSKAAGGAVAYLSGHGSWILSTDVSPNSKLVLSGSSDKTIKIWDIGQRAAVSTAQDTGDVWSVSWKPIPPEPGQGAGNFITAGDDGTVKWWRSAGAA